MKVQFMIKFMLIAISILLYGCKNNEIRFDFKTNSIKTIDNNGLYSLIISSKESLEDYYYIYLEKGQKAQDSISLVHTGNKYIIEDWWGKHIYKIILHPYRTYKISNISNGDCEPGRISFRTDSLGRPIMSSYGEKSGNSYIK